ncbi:efflux RND transporter periplasmic adaptor subunit [Ideonella sp. DXS29W]|uniref:Efflux RND transporter periplasmic adaptor subunit n=1 Tax=Ideonella lacteola TaxID=2984193 RepID=A0ABU9BIL6_9BURK
MDRTPLLMSLLVASLGLASALSTAAEPPATPALASTPAIAGGAVAGTGHDGVVEAVRQTVVAAQVPGAVVALFAKAGDRVKAGQVLLRLDSRAADQQAGAAAAQVHSARAAQDVATKEFERQKQLFQKSYISQAALERAEAQYKASMSQAQAQTAVAAAASTESSFYTVKAPYDGVVSDVSVVLGDMAMPGRPLLTLYDPAALRITAAVPQSAALRLRTQGNAAVMGELPGSGAELIKPLRWQVLPAIDPATHTVPVRLDLPAQTEAAPGMFARVWLPGAVGQAARVSVPVGTVVRRAELTGVYVIGSDGKPLLRQVRLGAEAAGRVEVLSGLGLGERVALDPQAAARVR